MKNKKYSTIPPLLEKGQTINDSKHKSEILNEHFASKASLSNSDENAPFLPKIPNIPSFDLINTSPIEVSKISDMGGW